MSMLTKGACVVFLALSTIHAARASSASERVLVVANNPSSGTAIYRRLQSRSAGARQVKYFSLVDGFATYVTNEELSQLTKDPDVVSVERVVQRHAFQATSSSDEIPYGITMVNAPRVWAATRGKSLDAGRPVCLAIADTGIAQSDEFISYRGGYNFIDPSSDPLDDNGHGSHVAAIAAASMNAVGVVGVAPEAELYSLKILDSCGYGTSEGIVAALDWVVERSQASAAHWVVNFSLGSNESSAAERLAVRRALAAGVLIIAAAGNAYSALEPEQIAYPAAYDGIIAVGAVDQRGQVADFSQRGSQLSLVAPGVAVRSLFLRGAVRIGEYTLPAVFATALDPSICVRPMQINGRIVFCSSHPAIQCQGNVYQHIAVFQDDDVAFTDLAIGAAEAGALAVIVISASDTTTITPHFQLPTNHSIVPLVLLTHTDGNHLLENVDADVSLCFADMYLALDGTSTAAPHVSGTAVLAWAIAPDASVAMVSAALIRSAIDLGARGRDSIYGFGLVNAQGATAALRPDLVPLPHRRAVQSAHLTADVPRSAGPDTRSRIATTQHRNNGTQ